MRKKITIIVLSLVMLFFASTSYACNFQMSQFGDPKEKIVINPTPLTFPDQFGGESMAIPIESLCKNDNSLYGTLVVYLYIENKLSQIQLYRPCLLYTSDAADEGLGVDLGGRRIIKKNKIIFVSLAILLLSRCIQPLHRYKICLYFL